MLITNVTIYPGGGRPVLDNAYCWIEQGRIRSLGSMAQLPDHAGVENLDAMGRWLLPGFVDCHTHLVFAGSREHEFVAKIQGKSYQEIAASGGGILNSSKRLQAAEEADLYDQAAARLERLISQGTTTIEIKSGYGLSLDAELKILRVVRRLKEMYPLVIKATFLGAHAFPKEMSREAYLDLVCEQMLPQVVDQGLADYCDVFCEEGFYSLAEAERVLTTAAQLGLGLRLHANQLTNNGGVQLGVRLGAASVDHLEHVGSAEIEALKGAATMPVFLPNCSFFLGIPYSPARDFLAAGVPFAIASDYNPGTSPSGNMPLLWSISCTQMKLTPAQAFDAMTLQAAKSLGLGDTHGLIAAGKPANLILTKAVPSFDYLPYSFGENWIDRVWTSAYH